VASAAWAAKYRPERLTPTPGGVVAADETRMERLEHDAFRRRGRERSLPSAPFGPAPPTTASGEAAMGLLGAVAERVPCDPEPVMVHELSGYWYSRWLFERGLACVYLVASWSR
jgi:hypothetical protein